MYTKKLALVSALVLGGVVSEVKPFVDQLVTSLLTPVVAIGSGVAFVGEGLTDAAAHTLGCASGRCKRTRRKRRCASKQCVVYKTVAHKHVC